MSLIKSISGIRGTIGGKPGDGLSPMDVVKFTSAFATWVKNNHKKELKNKNMEESVKKEQRQYWAVNRTFHSSMFEEVFKVGGKVIFYTISLEELKEISQGRPAGV